MGSNLTQGRLKDVLVYSEDTGEFVWRRPISNRVKAGAIAGTIGSDGYRKLKVDGARTGAHRLAFLYMTGEWPEHEVDHINGVRSDNRWCNLREVEHSRNMQNQRAAMVTNLVGLLGVTRARNRFTARIKLDGVTHHLGTFGTPEEAHAAYVTAKRELHPASTL